MLRNIEITRLLRYNRANMKELFEAEVWLRQMARLRNFVRKNSPRGFRAVLFRMVPKPEHQNQQNHYRFRAVLFRMVPKQTKMQDLQDKCFRAVLFRMVPKPSNNIC